MPFTTTSKEQPNLLEARQHLYELEALLKTIRRSMPKANSMSMARTEETKLAISVAISKLDAAFWYLPDPEYFPDDKK